jgi:N-acetylmuramoyl-L-alanine amidase
MRAVLIRDGDSFVPLKQRYMKARAAQADLFISIHADASPNDSATGASVFVLSTRGASSQAARWLADSENAADLVGGVKLDSKDANLAAVLLDLSQSATMRASDDVAGQVLAALKNVGKAHKPAIERANFVVLRSPDVPSMLVETGFITNPDEERRLNDRAYRARLAAAITDGVRRYFVGQPPPGSFFASSDAGSPVTSMASSPQ